MNLRDRRADQAKRHADELRATEAERDMAQARLRALMATDRYQAGFQDAVTVTLAQVQKWLADSREKAQGIIADLGDHANPDWKRGHDFSAEWIDHALESLSYEVALRIDREGKPA